MAIRETQVLDRRVADPATAANIREVAKLANRLLRDDIIQAILRGPVEVTFPAATPATLRVFHGLGRPVTGYIVTRLDSAATIYDGTFDPNDDPNLVVYLSASAGPCVAHVIFF